MKQLIKFCLISVFISAFSGLTLSLSEEWVINDIRISGLQRVSAGSVFNVMPISVGDTVDAQQLPLCLESPHLSHRSGGTRLPC